MAWNRTRKKLKNFTQRRDFNASSSSIQSIE
jgi:hypothetical protein